MQDHLMMVPLTLNGVRNFSAAEPLIKTKSLSYPTWPLSGCRVTTALVSSDLGGCHTVHPSKLRLVLNGLLSKTAAQSQRYP